MHNLIKKLIGDKREWHEYQARAEFADELLREYPEETWIDKQRRQLREETRGDQK